MKIPKLFKKAAAFVMAAVTALSIMPATAFAAGDIGTISFSHTYDSNGNAMRYNSSANIGGYMGNENYIQNSELQNEQMKDESEVFNSFINVMVQIVEKYGKTVLQELDCAA